MGLHTLQHSKLHVNTFQLTSTSEDDKQLKEDAVAAIENNRFKRGVRYYFNITEGTTVTYINK